MKRTFKMVLMLGLLVSACTSPAKQHENKHEATVTTEQVKEKENHGTIFHDLTFGEAVEKAKEEGKYVFIDCHTKNCGPCRQMEKQVFPKEECGKYLNSRFICIKKDMEQDAEDVKYLNEKYKLAIFPTFLIIKSDSTLLCSLSGAILEEGRFVEAIRSAISEAEAKQK